MAIGVMRFRRSFSSARKFIPKSTKRSKITSIPGKKCIGEENDAPTAETEGASTGGKSGEETESSTVGTEGANTGGKSGEKNEAPVPGTKAAHILKGGKFIVKKMDESVQVRAKVVPDVKTVELSKLVAACSVAYEKAGEVGMKKVIEDYWESRKSTTPDPLESIASFLYRSIKSTPP